MAKEFKKKTIFSNSLFTFRSIVLPISMLLISLDSFIICLLIKI